MARHVIQYSLWIIIAALICSKIVAEEPGLNDPDFLVQGKYTGEIIAFAGKQNLGVRVAALGDGKFFAMSYRGGLPGDGWDKGAQRKTDFQTVDGMSAFKLAVDESGTDCASSPMTSKAIPDWQRQWSARVNHKPHPCETEEGHPLCRKAMRSIKIINTDE